VSDYAIQARGLSKSYRIAANRSVAHYRTLQDSIVDLARRPFRRNVGAARQTFWALEDVSFEVPHGEALGIIGKNGAGKSTLLKILARITHPTRGTADIYGRMGSLLEVGTGFHPELTGRENIYLNGAILGMKRADIARRFDEIVAFAEVERFLDTPVKRYSTGMFMRLAFAVAAHLEPDILVVDEVLAVGDAAFQAKSLGRMNEVASSGRTVLFVSHNLAAVSQLCQKALLLESGRVKSYGSVGSVVGFYLSQGNADGHVDLAQGRAVATAPIQFTRAELHDSEDRICQDFPMGSDITVVFHLAFSDPSLLGKLSMSIKTIDGLQITHTVDDDAGFLLPTGASARTVRVRLPDVRFYPGSYRISLYCADVANTRVYDQAEDCLTFEIVDGGKFTSRPLPRHSGLFFVTPAWSAE
jgi:lipopolysaccharide transport system ATP-binding protein